jgi:hypothetical protein
MKSKPIVCDGRSLSRGAWCRELGGSPGLVSTRIRRNGWKPCAAATIPVNEKISTGVKRARRAEATRRVIRLGGVLIPKSKLGRILR